jgi:hypothetical protein
MIPEEQLQTVIVDIEREIEESKKTAQSDTMDT